MTADRQLTAEGLHNLRDLGGLTRRGGGVTRRGSVLRGCAMKGLTPAGQARLVALGITTCLDLRSSRERAEAPTALSQRPEVRDLHLPLFDALAPVYKSANSSRGFSLSARYAEALDKAGPLLAAAIAVVAGAPQGMILIHCTAGKDRTGLVAALLLSIADVLPEEIVADYHQSVTAGRPLIERLRRQSRARKTAPHLLDRMLDAPPEVMTETLERIERDHGGARAYLRRAGASEAQIEAAVQRLTGA